MLRFPVKPNFNAKYYGCKDHNVCRSVILEYCKLRRTLTILTSMFLFFTVPARVSTIGRVIYVPQNSDLDLPCRIVGDPLPTRKWFKNGRELSSDGMLNHALSSSR